MYASQPGNMRGPWVMTPLLLVPLLLTTLTGTVLCQHEEAETHEENASYSGDTVTAAEVHKVGFNTTSVPDASTTDGPAEDTIDEDHNSGQWQDSESFASISETTEHPSFMGETTEQVKEEGLDIVIILIPVVLAVSIISMIVCGFFISRRWNKKSKNEADEAEDPHLDESSTEKVPMPMFEEDVPSVLELEMEELDQWMKKEGDTAEDSKHV